MWLLYKNEYEYESIHVSCFKRKLSMNVKNDEADFGYMYMLCALKMISCWKTRILH